MIRKFRIRQMKNLVDLFLFVLHFEDMKSFSFQCLSFPYFIFFFIVFISVTITVNIMWVTLFFFQRMLYPASMCNISLLLLCFRFSNEYFEYIRICYGFFFLLLDINRELLGFSIKEKRRQYINSLHSTKFKYFLLNNIELVNDDRL